MPARVRQLRLVGVAYAGPALCRLDGELNPGRGVGSDLEAGPGLFNGVVVPPVHEGEPGGNLVRPSNDLLVLGGLAELVGRVSALLGVAHVELEA
jgi:hypothetical protein